MENRNTLGGLPHTATSTTHCTPHQHYQQRILLGSGGSQKLGLSPPPEFWIEFCVYNCVYETEFGTLARRLSKELKNISKVEYFPLFFLLKFQDTLYVVFHVKMTSTDTTNHRLQNIFKEHLICKNWMLTGQQIRVTNKWNLIRCFLPFFFFFLPSYINLTQVGKNVYLHQMGYLGF